MNKIIAWIVVIILIVFGLYYVLFFAQSSDGTIVTGPESSDTLLEPTVELSAVPSAGATAKPSVRQPTVPPAALSYSEAMTKYAGFRMQFDERCQASPAQLVVKNGKSIMLDNRSGDGRNFRVGGNTYYIKGYGWMILPMSAPASALPAVVTIGCGSANNVATIQIQK